MLSFLIGAAVIIMATAIIFFFSWLNEKFPDLKIFAVVLMFGGLFVYAFIHFSYFLGNELLKLI